MKVFAILVVIATNFLPIFTNLVLGATIEGERTYKALWCLQETNKDAECLYFAEKYCRNPCVPAEDRIHYLVLRIMVAEKLENWDERDRANAELKRLLEVSEEARKEFPSYYDCYPKRAPLK
jgi:hypothetical protein